MEWRIVLDLLQQMLQRDLSPDAISFGAGISACTLGTEKKHQHTGSSSQRCMCDRHGSRTTVTSRWRGNACAILPWSTAAPSGLNHQPSPATAKKGVVSCWWERGA